MTVEAAAAATTAAEDNAIAGDGGVDESAPVLVLLEATQHTDLAVKSSNTSGERGDVRRARRSLPCFVKAKSWRKLPPLSTNSSVDSAEEGQGLSAPFLRAVTAQAQHQHAWWMKLQAALECVISSSSALASSAAVEATAAAAPSLAPSVLNAMVSSAAIESTMTLSNSSMSFLQAEAGLVEAMGAMALEWRGIERREALAQVREDQKQWLQL
jgi:hypothetical protein